MTPRAALRRARLVGLLCAPLLAAACAGPWRPAPVIRQTYSETWFGVELLERVLVMPFRANLPVDRGDGEEFVPPSEAAGILTRLVVRELEAQGVYVLVGGDPADPTGVVRGEVRRYRELVGESVGANRPASVAFRIELLDPLTNQRAWMGEFDETQQALSANLVNAARYPGRGTRWLTAFDLAQWGVREAVTAMRTPPAAIDGDAP